MRVRAVVESRGVDIEFDVAAGEVLAVLGANGAGKSTVLHVIAGLVRPDRGVVRVGRTSADRHRRRESTSPPTTAASACCCRTRCCFRT